MGLLTPLLGQEFLDRHGLRDPLNRALKFGVKQGFSALGASTRQFTRIQGVGKPATRLERQYRRLLRPHPRRRPEDDRRDGRAVRRGDPATGRPRGRRCRGLPGRPDHQSRRTRHHRHQGSRGLRRYRRSAHHSHQRPRRRGTRLRRYGPGVADPGPRRGGVRADPLGQRRSAGHLSQRVRRGQCAAGLRDHRRTAPAVRPHHAQDHRGPHTRRLPPGRGEVTGPGRCRRRIVRRGSATQR